MKILLVGNYLADKQHSMQGFVDALMLGLCSRDVETRIITPRQVFGGRDQPSASLNKWLGYVDKYFLFPREFRKAILWADVVHVCDQGNALYIKHLKGVPHVITCHDVMAIRSALGEIKDWSTGITGRIYQRLILQGLRQAQSVVCVSQTTRRELLRISGISASRTSVVYNGLYHSYSTLDKREASFLLTGLGLSSPFILHVGGNQPYKNRLGVLKIFESVCRLKPSQTYHLLMAGKPFTQEMRDYIVQQGMEDRVCELTGLSNEQLQALYSCAEALLFPSLDEGFGLPIIEAQACRCPVFTTNRPPMTEIGGKAAVYFDPMEPIKAAQVVVDHLNATQQMRDAGLENITRFSRESMIDQYIQAYNSVLGNA